LIYAANGRFSLQIVRTRGKGLPGLHAISYFGRWELAPIEGCVVHQLDVSFKAGTAGDSEKQRYTFDAADRLSLATTSVSGTANTVFVWERQP
jgi:hypothetical protein